MSQNSRIKLLDGRVEYRKLKVVESLCARLYAQWVIRGVIAEMLPETPGLQRLKYIPTPEQAGSDELPAPEIHGLKFMRNGKREYPSNAAVQWLRTDFQG